MRIGITGNSAGIGKSISELPYRFIQFNREDGDIHQPEQVFERFKYCDVFINNAWDGDCQTKLLKFFFDQWKDEPKKIVSIGSSVASYNPSGTGYSDYVDLKRQLRQLHLDIVNLKTTKCRSYLVNPGVTDTKMTAEQNRKKMSGKNVADIIKFVLENELYVPEIYFYAE